MSYLLEDLIPHDMPLGVVDVFKFINIKVDKGEGVLLISAVLSSWLRMEIMARRLYSLVSWSVLESSFNWLVWL